MPGFKELLIFGEFFMLKIFLFMNIGSYKVFAGAMVTVAPIIMRPCLLLLLANAYIILPLYEVIWVLLKTKSYYLNVLVCTYLPNMSKIS